MRSTLWHLPAAVCLAGAGFAACALFLVPEPIPKPEDWSIFRPLPPGVRLTFMGGLSLYLLTILAGMIQVGVYLTFRRVGARSTRLAIAGGVFTASLALMLYFQLPHYRFELGLGSAVALRLHLEEVALCAVFFAAALLYQVRCVRVHWQAPHYEAVPT